MVAPLYVPITRTPVALEALVPALLGVFPEAEAIDIAIIFGKLVAECGWPSGSRPQSVWCWNLGNIRGTSPGGRYTLLRDAWELADVGKVPAGATILDPPPSGAYVPPGKVAYLLPVEHQKFRAYESLAEACEDYVTVLGARFPRAWKELADVDTDAGTFVLTLKAERYFTGDETVYLRNVRSGAAHALPRVEAMLEEIAAARLADTDPPPSAPLEWSPQTSAHTALPDIVPQLPSDADEDSNA